jgi:fructokinase
MNSRFTIVGLGEALVDILPGSQHVGGATLNVALCAQQLAAPSQGRGVLVSRLGQDALGHTILEHLKSHQVDTSYLQHDPDLATGTVYVQFDAQGQPAYDIVENVAWDVIQFDPELADLARRCTGVCFGSLAQRHPQSRSTIDRFIAAASRAVRLFDVNLRGQFYDSALLRKSCEQASAVKLNEEELPIVCGLLGLDLPENDEAAAAGLLLQQYDLKLVVITHGSKGTTLYDAQGAYPGKAVSYPPAPSADPVGAGDACAAAILTGLALRFDMARLADLANHVGAFVASQPGATPPLPEKILNMFA